MGDWIQEVKIAELKPVPVVKSKLEEQKEGFLRNMKYFLWLFCNLSRYTVA